MSRSLSLSFFALALSFNIGCSGSGSGGGKNTGNYKPLSGDNKIKVSKIYSSLSSSMKLVQSYVPKSKSSSVHRLTQLMIADSDDDMIGVSTGSANDTDLKAGEMKKLIDQNDCKMDLPTEVGQMGSSDAGVDIPTFEVSISGLNCPVLIIMGVKVDKQNDKGFSGKLYWHFEALSVEYKKLADVDVIDMQGKISGTFNKVGDQLTIAMSADFDGKAHSQLEGPFKVGFVADTAMLMTIPSDVVLKPNNVSANPPVSAPINMPINFNLSGHFNVAYILNLSKIDSLLEEKVTFKSLTDVKDEHFLNHQSITTEEFNKLLSEMKYLDVGNGMPDQSTGGSTDHKDANHCQIDVFDSAQLSREALQESIDQNKAIFDFPLAHFDSCGQQREEMNVNGDKLLVDWIKQVDMFQMNMSFESKPQVPALSEYTYPQEELNLAESYEDLTVHFYCTPQVMCP